MEQSSIKVWRLAALQKQPKAASVFTKRRNDDSKAQMFGCSVVRWIKIKNIFYALDCQYLNTIYLWWNHIHKYLKQKNRFLLTLLLCASVSGRLVYFWNLNCDTTMWGKLVIGRIGWKIFSCNGSLNYS